MGPPALSPVRVNPVCTHPDERRVGLSGEWGFRLDPEDRGLAERWFADPTMLAETISVPGSWQAQGFGGDGEVQVRDFRLMARTFRATYEGTGWYGRHFRPPAQWQGGRLWLNFGGVHPTAEVWLDGRRLGENHLPFLPFGFEVTELLRFDADHWLAVRVSEEDAELGLLYAMYGPWGGIYRDVELTATGPCHLERLWLYPEPEQERLRVKVSVDGPSTDGLILRVSTGDGDAIAAEWPLQSPEAEFALEVPSPALWSPDSPHLYRVDTTLLADGEVTDARSERVGFVTLTPEGRQFLINGEPYYMRGHGDFDFPPERGCPDTDRERWRKKLSALRAYGYNHVRCQSFAPTPEYLDAADEVGLLIQSEMGSLGAWGGHSHWHGYNWPEPTPQYRERIKLQWDRVVERDVNHPSANLYCMSNERWTGFAWPRTAWQCYHDTRAVKPTALIIWTDGGVDEGLPQDFINCVEGMDDRCTSKPIIRHEFRWWSSFPDVTQMHRFDGGLRPFAAEMALDRAARSGFAHTLPAAARNSQRVQFIEAKGKMEACRRDYPYLAGISHFSAIDCVPSPQGILDAFYERKYADAETWLQTNGDTVVMSSLGFDDRVLASGDTLRCKLSVSDFAHPPMRAPALDWAVTCEGAELAAGRIEYAHEPYTTCRAGAAEFTAPDMAQPVKASLRAVLREGDRQFANEWDLWLFPAEVGLPAGVAVYAGAQHTWLAGLSGLPVVDDGSIRATPDVRAVLTERLDDPLVEFMRSGGRVLLAASEGLEFRFLPKLGLSVGRYYFTPPAQYPPLENGHNGTIIADHPMLGDFPHEGFGDLSFYRMMGESAALELIPLGLNAQDPIIRAMHSYPIGRSLGYLTECAVGQGGMVLCALDLNQAWPEARHLLACLCGYLCGDAFAPPMELDEPSLQRIMQFTALP